MHIVDTFDTPIIDGATWNVLINGSNGTVVQKNGKLLISIGAGAQPGGAYNFVGVQYGTKACYAGDIDMQVDYQLIQWPPSSGAYVSLQAVFANAMAERYWDANGGGDQYASIIDPRFKGGVLATGTSGSLRVTRINGVATTYYLANGAWQVIDSAPATRPAHLHIGLSLVPNISPTSDITVALDNFSATAYGPTSC